MRPHYRFEMRHDDNAGGGRGEGRGRREQEHRGRGHERGEHDARTERRHGRDFERGEYAEREEGHHRRKRFSAMVNFAFLCSISSPGSPVMGMS